MSGWCKLPSCIACVQTPQKKSPDFFWGKGDVCTQATSCTEVFLILIRCAVYSKTAFIGNFTSISGVWSRAACNRINTVRPGGGRSGKCFRFGWHKTPCNLLGTALGGLVVLVFLQVKRPLVKAAWWILFLERRSCRVVPPSQRPPYVNWSMERDLQWWCTLKTRILRQERPLKTSHLTNLLNKVVVVSRSRLLFTRKVHRLKRLNFSGLTTFYKWVII